MSVKVSFYAMFGNNMKESIFIMLTSQWFFALHIDMQNHIHTRVHVYIKTGYSMFHSFSVVGLSIGNLHMEPESNHFLKETVI